MSQCLTCTTGTACTACKPGFVTAACVPCQAPCLTCITSPTICSSCFPGSAFYLQFGGGSCVAKELCTSGSYAETNNQCMGCASDCATCIDFPDKCLTCSDPLKTWKNYKCVPNCSAGYAAMGGLCCPDKCTVCDLNEKCGGCIPGYYLETDSTCQQCSSNCLTCTNQAGFCLTCPAGKVL